MNASQTEQTIVERGAQIARAIGQATPGPWVAEPHAGRGAWVSGSNGEWSALACGNTDATADANARLIAAAPDLLAIMKGFVSLVDGVGLGRGKKYVELCSPSARRNIEEMRAAISKAEGR